MISLRFNLDESPTNALSVRGLLMTSITRIHTFLALLLTVSVIFDIK